MELGFSGGSDPPATSVDGAHWRIETGLEQAGFHYRSVRYFVA